MDTTGSDAPAPLTRSVDLPVTADELWALVASGDGWQDWLVDEADVDVRAGAGGQVVDDGEERTVAVEEVHDGDPQRRVVFRWWTEGGAASRVTLVVAPAPISGGSVLHITEVPVAPVRASMSAHASVGSMALLRLWLAAATLVRG